MVQIPSPKLTAKFTPENQELEDEVAFWNGSFWGGHVNIHALRKKCSYHRLLISSIWSSCSLKPCRSSWWDLWSCNILCRICTCSACIPGSHQSAAKSSCWHSSSARNPCSEWRPCPCHSLNFWPYPFQTVPRGERTNTFCSCSKSKNIFSHLQISGQIATVPTPELREFWRDSLSITTIWDDYSAVLSL